jgi:hypothetical protein
MIAPLPDYTIETNCVRPTSAGQPEHDRSEVAILHPAM